MKIVHSSFILLALTWCNKAPIDNLKPLRHCELFWLKPPHNCCSMLAGGLYDAIESTVVFSDSWKLNKETELKIKVVKKSKAAGNN